MENNSEQLGKQLSKETDFLEDKQDKGGQG